MEGSLLVIQKEGSYDINSDSVLDNSSSPSMLDNTLDTNNKG
jgi:hypothetical protein